MVGSRLRYSPDDRIVAVRASDAYGNIEIVNVLQYDTCDVFHDIDQLVDGNHLR
jgi:hypothetical protein